MPVENIIFIDEWCEPLPPLELNTMIRLQVKKQGRIVHQTMSVGGLLVRCGLDARPETLELLVLKAHELMRGYWNADSVVSLRA